MKFEKTGLGINLAVGLVGVIVGIDYLLRWGNDFSLMKDLFLGTTCTLLAASWIIYNLMRRNRNKE